MFSNREGSSSWHARWRIWTFLQIKGSWNWHFEIDKETCQRLRIKWCRHGCSVGWVVIGGIEEVREKLEVNTQTQCLRDSNACEWGYKCTRTMNMGSVRFIRKKSKRKFSSSHTFRIHMVQRKDMCCRTSRNEKNWPRRPHTGHYNKIQWDHTSYHIPHNC